MDWKARIIKNYTVMEKIGSGNFAVVWRAVDKSDGRQVAIKEMVAEKLNKHLREQMLFEISLLRKINHPNIVRLLDTIETSGDTYLVLEYCGGGDLATYIKLNGIVSQSTTRKFIQQLGAGLKVLHANRLIHRDLKPENLLLSTNGDELVLKIADFGLARHVDSEGYAENVCGSALYMAPEVMRFQKYDIKADLWSVGVILFQLLTGQFPFQGKNHVELLRNILKSSGLPYPKDLMPKLDSDSIDLCQRLLCSNPENRLAFHDFVTHKFMWPI